MNRTLLKSEILRRIRHRLGEVRRVLELLTAETDVEAALIVLEISRDGEFHEDLRLREGQRTYPAPTRIEVTAT